MSWPGPAAVGNLECVVSSDGEHRLCRLSVFSPDHIVDVELVGIDGLIIHDAPILRPSRPLSPAVRDALIEHYDGLLPERGRK